MYELQQNCANMMVDKRQNLSNCWQISSVGRRFYIGLKFQVLDFVNSAFLEMLLTWTYFLVHCHLRLATKKRHAMQPFMKCNKHAAHTQTHSHTRPALLRQMQNHFSQSDASSKIFVRDANHCNQACKGCTPNVHAIPRHFSECCIWYVFKAAIVLRWNLGTTTKGWTSTITNKVLFATQDQHQEHLPSSPGLDNPEMPTSHGQPRNAFSCTTLFLAFPMITGGGWLNWSWDRKKTLRCKCFDVALMLQLLWCC